ncbi:hypothetical protein BC828DRAFT_382880 [Blastocladiella britannica]|nr:hypothetical protein BC828DRAFT_382880 [Blastocladiella britannica]
MSMIKPKALAAVLSEVCTGGTRLALLVHHDGALLAFGSGPSEDAAGAERDAHVHAALAAAAWGVYDKNGTPLVSMVVESGTATVFATRVSSALTLALVANPDADLGALRLRGLALREYLEEPLRSVAAQ